MVVNFMRRLTQFICLFVITILVGCVDEPAPVLRVGTDVCPGYEPLYLARQQGGLTRDKVRLLEFSSASQVIQAYRNNLVDAAALTLDEVLLLLESGEKLKIVLVMDISNGNDAIVGQSDIATLAEIKGKRIGVESSALGAYVISRALEIANLNVKSIKIIMLDINEQEHAFLQHKVDAVVTSEPVRTKLLKSGGRLLFDSRQLPGEIVSVLVVRGEYLSRYPETVRYLLNGWHQALAFMKQQPSEAAKILGLRMQLGVDATLASYEGLILPDQKENQQLLKQQPRPLLLLSVNNLAEVMVQQGFLKKNPDTSLLFSESNP